MPSLIFSPLQGNCGKLTHILLAAVLTTLFNQYLDTVRNNLTTMIVPHRIIRLRSAKYQKTASAEQ